MRSVREEPLQQDVRGAVLVAWELLGARAVPGVDRGMQLRGRVEWAELLCSTVGWSVHERL